MGKNMTLIEVLRGGRQCDNDGVEIIMSRQACLEAADEIEKLHRIGEALIYANDRGQGLQWQDAMKELSIALGHNAVLSGKPPRTEI
jgi:hypothetical protein